MVETAVDFRDELIIAMREELERALAEERSYAINMEGTVVNADAEYRRRKKTIMDVLAVSVRTQRLYFVIRSAIMSLISALMFFIVVLYLGSIDATQAVFLGIFLFVASLIVSRLFDRQIVRVTKRIIHFLKKHKRAMTLVLKKL